MTKEERRELDRKWEATGYPELGIDVAQPGVEPVNGGAMCGAAFGLVVEAVVAVALFVVYEVIRFWMR